MVLRIDHYSAFGECSRRRFIGVAPLGLLALAIPRTTRPVGGVPEVSLVVSDMVNHFVPSPTRTDLITCQRMASFRADASAFLIGGSDSVAFRSFYASFRAEYLERVRAYRATVNRTLAGIELYPTDRLRFERTEALVLAGVALLAGLLAWKGIVVLPQVLTYGVTLYSLSQLALQLFQIRDGNGGISLVASLVDVQSRTLAFLAKGMGDTAAFDAISRTKGRIWAGIAGTFDLHRAWTIQQGLNRYEAIRARAEGELGTASLAEELGLQLLASRKDFYNHLLAVSATSAQGWNGLLSASALAGCSRPTTIPASAVMTSRLR